MSDLEHVAAVLEGRSPPARPAPGRGRGRGRQPHPQQQPGSGGGARERRGGRRGTSWPPAGGTRQQQHGSHKARRGGQQQQPAEPGQGSSSGGAAVPAQEAQQEQQRRGQQGASSPYNEPGPQSSSRLWHCTACDVWVPRRPGDWETHTRGIRHQRQLLSLRVTGERGRLVLSAFESGPGLGEPAYRLVGKGAAQFGLAGPSGPAAAAGGGRALRALPEQQQAAARALRTQALAQLLNLFGVGQTYNAAAQELSEQHLAAALSAPQPVVAAAPAAAPAASAAAGGPVGAGAGAMPAATTTTAAAAGAAVVWAQPGGEQAGGEQLLRLQTAAALAAVAHSIAERGWPHAHAHLEVDLEGRSFGGVAAALATLRLLLGALGAAPSLSRLTLTLRHSGMGAMPTYQLGQLERAWGAHVVQGLGGLLELNPGIRSIVLEVPASLVAPSQRQLPALRRVASAAPLAARQHLLLALHPRAGRCSALQLLPLPLVHAVMELAAPLAPCTIEVHAVDAGQQEE